MIQQPTIYKILNTKFVCILYYVRVGALINWYQKISKLGPEYIIMSKVYIVREPNKNTVLRLAPNEMTTSLSIIFYQLSNYSVLNLNVSTVSIEI